MMDPKRDGQPIAHLLFPCPPDYSLSPLPFNPPLIQLFPFSPPLIHLGCFPAAPDRSRSYRPHPSPCSSCFQALQCLLDIQTFFFKLVWFYCLCPTYFHQEAQHLLKYLVNFPMINHTSCHWMNCSWFFKNINYGVCIVIYLIWFGFWLFLSPKTCGRVRDIITLPVSWEPITGRLWKSHRFNDQPVPTLHQQQTQCGWQTICLSLQWST